MSPAEERRELFVFWVVVGAVVLCAAAAAYFSLVKVNWLLTKEVFDVVKNIATIVAILIGGVWTYFNFAKGRIYRPRLEPKIAGKIISKDGAGYLITVAQLKNIGLSKVELQSRGTAVTIYSYRPAKLPVTEVNDAILKELAVIPVFKEHKWIEPGATLEDQSLLEIPSGEQFALRVELRLVYNERESNIGVVVEYPADADSAKQKNP